MGVLGTQGGGPQVAASLTVIGSVLTWFALARLCCLLRNGVVTLPQLQLCIMGISVISPAACHDSDGEKEHSML